MRSWYKIKKNGHGTVITKAMEEYLSQRQLMGRNPSVPAWPNYNELVIASFPVGTDAQSNEQRLREREKLFNDYGIFSEDLESFLSMVDIWCSDPSSPGYEEGKLYNITCNPKLLNMTLMHLGTKSNKPEEDPDKKGLNLLKHKDGIFLHPPAWEYGFFLTENIPPYTMETDLEINGYTVGTVNTKAIISDPNYDFAHPKKWIRNSYASGTGPKEIFGFNLNGDATYWDYEEEKHQNGHVIDYDNTMIFTNFTTYNPNLTEGHYWPNDPTIPENKRAVNIDTYPYGPLACMGLRQLNAPTPLPPEKSNLAEVRVIGTLDSVCNNLKIKHLAEYGSSDFIEGEYYTKPWRETKVQVQENMFTGGYILSSDLSNHNIQLPCKWYNKKDKCIAADLGNSNTFKITDIDYGQIEYFEPQPPGHDFNYENYGVYAVGISAYTDGNIPNTSRYEFITVMPNGHLTTNIYSECEANFIVQPNENTFVVNVNSKFGPKWDSLDMGERDAIIQSHAVELYINTRKYSGSSSISAYVNNNFIGEFTADGQSVWQIPLANIVQATGHQTYETFPANIQVTIKHNGSVVSWSFVGVRPVEPDDRKDESAFE